jgi:hypothetical protein
MNHLRTLSCFALAWLGSVVLGCSDDSPAEKVIEVTERIGSAGGSLRLEDTDGSSFEVRIPAGALAQEQEITIRKIPAASWPSEVQENPPIGDAVFELLPEGTTFSVPITTISRFPSAPAGLVDGTRQTLPSHASRSTAGAVERHPTTVTSRTDGSAVMIGRTDHFSVHWLSTKTDDGEFGVNLAWPPGLFGIDTNVEPDTFTVWTSSETSPNLTVTIGVFAELPDGGTQVLFPGFFMLGGDALGTPVETALMDFLADTDDTRSLSSAGTTVSTEVTYPVGMPHVFGLDYVPTFTCTAEGAGTGWVVVITSVTDGGAGTVPLIYVNEVNVECSSAA